MNQKRVFDYDDDAPNNDDDDDDSILAEKHFQIKNGVNYPSPETEEQVAHEAFVERLRHAARTDHEINMLAEYGHWSNIKTAADRERMNRSSTIQRLVAYLASYRNVPLHKKKPMAPLDLITEMYYTGTVMCYLHHHMQSSSDLHLMVVEVLNERLQDTENCITTCLVFASDDRQMAQHSASHPPSDEIVPIMNKGQEDLNMAITESNLEDHLKNINTRKKNIQQLSVPMRFINHFFDFYPVSIRAQARTIPL